MKKATALLICLLIGGYHLFIFCNASEIPLPLDIFTASSALIIFGLTTIFTTLSIGLTPCLIVGVTPYLQESKIYQELFYTEENSQLRKNINNTETRLLIKGIKNYFLLFSSTSLLLSGLIIFYEEIKEYIGDNIINLVLLEVLTSSLFFSLYVLSKNRVSDYLQSLSKIQYYQKRVTNFLWIVGIKFIWLISLGFVLLWSAIIFNIKNDLITIFLLLLTIISNCVFLIPRERRNSFQETAEKYNKRGIILSTLKNTYLPSAFILFIIITFLLIHPMIIEKTFAATLKILRLGGNMQAVYYYNPKDKDDFPKEIIDICNTDETCKTKKLTVIIDIGSTFYARLANGLIYSLPRQKLKLAITPKQKSEPAISK